MSVHTYVSNPQYLYLYKTIVMSLQHNYNKYHVHGDLVCNYMYIKIAGRSTFTTYSALMAMKSKTSIIAKTVLPITMPAMAPSESSVG